MKILIEEHGEFVSLTKLNGDLQEQFTTRAYPYMQGWHDFLFNWFMLKMKDVLYNLPMKVEVIFGKVSEQTQQAMGRMGVFLQNTAEMMRKHEKLKDKFKNNAKILFLNVSDDARYVGLYDKIQLDKTYLSFWPGFNRKLRQWEDTPIPVEFDELLALIEKEKIGQIVTVNHYWSSKYHEKLGFDIVSLFWFMGLKWTTIDNDPSDLHPAGFLHRNWQTPPGELRFTNLSLLNRYWDEYYGMDAEYIALPSDFTKGNYFELDHNYDVVIITNSRWGNIEPQLDIIKEVLEGIPDVYRDIHTWYLAMRQSILERPGLRETEKLHYNSFLHALYYHAVNWLKYKAIGDIKTDRKVRLFGDEGWEIHFPQYYEGVLDNEQIEALWKEKNHLYMLVNCSFNYLDASGPVYDGIGQDVPWINVPPMVSTKTFEKFKSIEYNNQDELNELINGKYIKVYEGLKGVTQTYKKILDDSVQSMLDKISGKNTQRGELFVKHLGEHQSLIDSKVTAYMENNTAFLQHCLQKMFQL
jgi:hypothetical protein